MADEIEIDENELDEFRKWKSEKDNPKAEPEQLDIESLAEDVEEPETKQEELECSGCGFKPLSKSMKYCPSCKCELAWQ